MEKSSGIDEYQRARELLGVGGLRSGLLLSFISSMGLPVGAELALIYGGVLASGQVRRRRREAAVAGPGDRRRRRWARSSAPWPATASGATAAGPWSTRSGSTSCSPTRTSTGPTPGSPAGVSPSCSSGGSSRCCGPSCPSRPAWARWRSASSSSSPSSRCAIWCTALCSLGYSLGSSYNHVLKAFSYAGYILGGARGHRRRGRLLAPLARVPQAARHGADRDRSVIAAALTERAAARPHGECGPASYQDRR